MTDNTDTAVWEKLDKLYSQGVELRITVERLVGDSKTSNAEILGKLALMNQRLDNTEAQHLHMKSSTDERFLNVQKLFDKQADRLMSLENDKTFMSGKRAGWSFVFVTFVAIVAVIANIMKAIT